MKALDGLSFQVNEGEIYGLLGPNGAGKTTALRIIATLLKADSGSVRALGADISLDPRAFRQNLAFLSSDLKLDEFFSPAYHFDFFSALRDIPKERARERREQLFERFGISSYAHKKLHSLSAGMKQKAAFVVSIAHDPPIILFDEPTNGMDLLSARTVKDFLLELKDRGKTIILSTHLFGLAEGVCDSLGFIVDGKMLHSGSLGELTQGQTLESAFFSLYDKQGARE